MAKGENIFKRKDGRWEARYGKGHDAAGKLKYGFCYGKTYKEAKEKVTKAKSAVAAGKMYSQNSSHKFSQYCEEWLYITRNRVKPATYIKYESILNNHIKPNLGAYYPQALNTVIISRFSDYLLKEKHLAVKTVRDVLTCLRSVVKFCAKQLPGALDAVEIIYPKEEAKEMRVLSTIEQKRLTVELCTDMDECKFGILLALLTGMRIGEICALRWGDINLTDNTIYVHATMQRLKSFSNSGNKTQIVVGTPKSEKSMRIIPLTEQAASLCGQMMQRSPSAFVLTGTDSYMEPRALQYRLKKYTTACGLDGVHFHTLRHTFATRCVEVGFDVKTLSEILGHSSTTVTLNRYVHSSMELKRANMEKLSTIGM